MDESPVTNASLEPQKQFILHSNVLRGFVLGLCPDRNLVEDVLQETFVVVAARGEEFSPGTNFLAWARGIARRKLMEQLRQRNRVPLLEAEALDALAGSVAELDDTWEVRRVALASCLQELSPRARQIVALRFDEDALGLPAIAARLSWSIGAVKVALSRARKFLADCARRRTAKMEG